VANQQPMQVLDDGIDPRAYVDVLIRRGWLILALIALAVATAGILSYVVLPPTYESSLVVSLPAADGSNELGMPPQAYEEFAASDPVLAATRKKLELQVNPGQSGAHYDIRLGPNTHLLTIATSAETAKEAWLSATLWVDAFYEETLATLQTQLTGKKATAEQAVTKLLADVTESEDTLATFDRENPLSLRQAQLLSMETELVDVQRSLRDLALSSIPTDEARLVSLENALAAEPEILNGSIGSVTLPEENPGAGVTSSDITMLNPVYLQLSQDLAATRTRLATSQKKANTLEGRITSLQDEADSLRNTFVTLQSSHERLSRNRSEVVVLYNPARSELDTFLALEPRLPELARPLVVSEPTLPQTPVAPRKVLNMVLSGVVAAIVGVLVAFFLEWYRDGRVTGASNVQEAGT